ncbi:MAG: endonuclease/exonuclease/phosphatase family protein [Verrucomicrobia bacterium]|nr:endonuclease/exonuclease/phosphatase family protein [Verrucomicrobiota bacterium]
MLLTAAAGAAPAPITLRVMSYNIHHGEGLDGKVDLARIALVITEARADIVGLQEVDRGVQRTQGRDLPAELARLTGLTVYFEKNIAYQGGEYGNAVLSRFPIRSAKNTHYRMLRPGEQRGIQQLVLDVHGREILFLNTHLDYRPDDAERLSNVAEIQQIVAAAGRRPVLLVGDFNTRPGTPTHEGVKAFLRDAWEAVGQGDGFTIPVKKPNRRIDYLFVTPASVEPISMQVLHTEASDHLPIIAEVRLK